MASAADDVRHSVLGKARPLSQAALDAFCANHAGPLLPPSEYGRFEVKEVDVKTALTKCAMPGEPWTINPYMGCSHDCAYCYVPDVAHVERPKWGSYVVVKRNLPTLLALELQKKEPKPVFLSSATDCYQPVEKEHRITRRSLELLLKHDWPLHVLTRNPLVKRDTDLFQQFSQCGVGMSVPTLDDEARRIIEPGAPNIEGRLRTLRALADAGLDTFANIMPTYPLTSWSPDEIARAFKDTGVREVHAGAWRYTDTVVPVLRERTRGTAYEDLWQSVTDPGYYRRMLRSLQKAFERVGLPLRVEAPQPVAGRSPSTTRSLVTKNPRA